MVHHEPADKTYRPPLDRRLIAGLTFLTFSLVSFVINVIVLLAIRRKWTLFRRYSFYVLSCHLLVASLGILVGQFVVVVPISLSGRPLYGDGWLLITLASGDTFFFFAVFTVSLLIALNRLAALLAPKLYNWFFEDYRLHITSLLPWLVGIFWVVNTTVIGCPKVFRHDNFYYQYRCPANLTGYPDGFMHATERIAYIVPAFILVAYCAVVGYMRKSQWGSAVFRKTNEAHVLVQAGLICFFLETETTLFKFLPDLLDHIRGYWLSLILNYILVTNATVNSTLMLIYNIPVRRSAFNMLRSATKRRERARVVEQQRRPVEQQTSSISGDWMTIDYSRQHWQRPRGFLTQ